LGVSSVYTDNPVLYTLMYGRKEGRQSRAAQTADAELRRGLEQLADAGLLRIGVDEAMAVTTALAIGCVTQLVHGGGSATGAVARLHALTKHFESTPSGVGRGVAMPGGAARSPVMIPIPARSLEHLADNIGATEVAVQLTDEEVRALTRAAATVTGSDTP
jgi:hypothetical protein